MEAPGPFATRGGMIVRAGGALALVPSELEPVVVSPVPVTPVPGTPFPLLGLALAQGDVVTVLALNARPSKGSPSAPLVLCRLDGARVALAGLEVLASGRLPACDGGVLWQGERVAPLDLHALVERAESSILAARDAARRRRREGGRRPSREETS